MERIDKHFEKLAAASFARYGFAYGELLARWPEVAGTGIAAICRPERIKWPRGGGDDKRKLGGTLILKTEPGHGLEVQYQVPLILERVNQFYGYGAISEAVVRQASTSHRKLLKNNQKTLDPGEREKISSSVSTVEDETLKAALARLGEGVLARAKVSPQDE